MRLEEISGRQVVSVNEGEKLGEVHDLLLAGSYLTVGALVVGGGGLFGGARKAMAYDAVRGIGPDAVMVMSRDAVQDVADGSALGEMHRLADMNQEVLSESGIRLGKVSDVEFDPQDGAVTALVVDSKDARNAPAAAPDLVPREDILSISAKVVVVRHAVIERADQAGPAGALHEGPDAAI